MPVLRIGGQSRRSQGRRNRYSLVWNGGFENAASGDEWSLRRAVCVFLHPASCVLYVWPIDSCRMVVSHRFVMV